MSCSCKRVGLQSAQASVSSCFKSLWTMLFLRGCPPPGRPGPVRVSATVTAAWVCFRVMDRGSGFDLESTLSPQVGGEGRGLVRIRSLASKLVQDDPNTIEPTDARRCRLRARARDRRRGFGKRRQGTHRSFGDRVREFGCVAISVEMASTKCSTQAALCPRSEARFRCR